MLRFVLRRMLSAIPSLFGLMIVTFLLIRIVPADPAAALAGDNATPQQIADIRHQYGFDRPVGEQLLLYIGQVLRFNFGESQYSHRPVGLDIRQRLPATLELTFAALLIAIVFGIPLGVIAGVHHNRWPDFALRLFSITGIAVAAFWFAIMLQLLFAVYGIPLLFGYRIQLPSAGICETDVCGLGEVARHIILPAIVLSLAFIAQYSRFMRSSMLEVIRTDYMRTAAAKGVSRPAVIFKHGFKNALIPLVTIVALSLPGLVAGAVVTETIFAWPGMGRLFINALGQFDFALLMGYMMMVSFFVIFCNLLADVCYAWLDPRVKYS